MEPTVLFLTLLFLSLGIWFAKGLHLDQNFQERKQQRLRDRNRWR